MLVAYSLTCFVLTYMATIDAALTAGVLEYLHKPAWEMRAIKRPMCFANEFIDWVDNKSELYDTKRAVGGRDLYDQLELFLWEYQCCDRPTAGDLRRVMPVRDGVFKFHPPDLRIYGWFYQPGGFVAVAGALAEETKGGSGLNDIKREEVLNFAARHELAGTIMRGELNEVVCEKIG